MNLGIGTKHQTLPIQVTLGSNEVLRVTANGQFVWHPEADRMIEECDFSFNPALPHILRALRKREWVGLTDEQRTQIRREHYARTLPLMDAVEAALKENNT